MTVLDLYVSLTPSSPGDALNILLEGYDIDMLNTLYNQADEAEQTAKQLKKALRRMVDYRVEMHARERLKK